MTTMIGRLDFAAARLFEALRRQACDIRSEMARIDRAAGAPTAPHLNRLRTRMIEFQSLKLVLENALAKTREGGAVIRKIVSGISRKLLLRALTYEAAYAARLEAGEAVPLFGAVMFARDLRQLDLLAGQVAVQPAELEAEVIAARGTLQSQIKRCPKVADFG